MHSVRASLVTKVSVKYYSLNIINYNIKKKKQGQ